MIAVPNFSLKEGHRVGLKNLTNSLYLVKSSMRRTWWGSIVRVRGIWGQENFVTTDKHR